MSAVAARTSLEMVNQDLRSGGIRATARLSVLAAVHAVVLVQYLPQLDSPARWAGLGASLVLGTLVIAGTWVALRTLGTRLSEEGVVTAGFGRTSSIRWDEVMLLRRDVGRIVLERIGAPATVIPLPFVCRPDELQAAVRNLVPNRALQRGGARG